MPSDSIEALVAGGDVGALLALCESRDPRVAKDARRGLHRLRSRGVAVPDAAIRRRVEPARADAVQGDEVPSLATSSDGAGERLVWLARKIDSGAQLFQAHIHEADGLCGFESSEFSLRQLRAMRRDLLASGELPCAEIPTDYAHWLIEEAWERTLAARRAPPAEFVRARAELRAAPRRFAEHPARAEVQPTQAGEERMAELLAAPACAGWAPEPEELSRLALRLEEVQSSRLLVNDAQRADQRRLALRRTVAEYFTPERRERFARRLLDAAYIVHRAGGAHAGVLRAAADALLDPDRDVEQQPFAMGLFGKYLRPDPDEPAARARSPQSGLVLPP